MKFDYLKNLALVSQIGLLMAIPIFLCIFIGHWIDGKLGTNGLFLVIFLILGVLAAFRNLFVTVLNRVDSGKKGSKHDRK
ncbi:MAG: F0F1 ATP synthase subunit [Firmicutes bacterium HGW-Firmicutes-3]|jgi:F0F1-type ATP synthase assembly protein I|nr:MAG: F0F1 ATP synthase subunit [Firmicutes bacterium HGW-Firmicutes-3]